MPIRAHRQASTPHQRRALTLPALLPLACACAALTGGPAARAEGGQDLRFRANTSLVHDSNLFRLPSGANTQALTGRSSASETIRVTGVGVNLNKAFSLQQFEVDLSLSKYNYSNFSFLDFTAVNYDAQWRWAYTPRLRGNLRTSRDQSLNNYTDFQGFNIRNIRRDHDTRLDATYELDARWRVSGGLSETGRTNSVQANGVADYRQTTGDVGLRYVVPSGSSIGYTLRSSDGSYTSNRTIPSVGLYDNQYSQTDNELRADWAFSRDSQAQLRLGHRSRSHPNYPQRNFSGMTGGASLNWTLSPKTALVASWTRDLGSFETGDFNFTQSDRIALRPVWQFSPKLNLRGELAFGTRDFRGTPTGLVTLQRRDHTRDASVSVDWQPYTFLSLSAALQSARRTSSLAGFDFNSQSINFSAQFTY